MTDSPINFTQYTSALISDYIVTNVIEGEATSLSVKLSKRNHLDLFQKVGLKRFEETFTGNESSIEQVRNLAMNAYNSLLLSSHAEQVWESFVLMGRGLYICEEVEKDERIFNKEVPTLAELDNEELYRELLLAFIYYILIFTVRDTIKINHKIIERASMKDK